MVSGRQVLLVVMEETCGSFGLMVVVKVVIMVLHRVGRVGSQDGSGWDGCGSG